MRTQVSAVGRTTDLAVTILPMALEICRLFGGFFLPPAKLPSYFVWLDVLSYGACRRHLPLPLLPSLAVQQENGPPLLSTLRGPARRLHGGAVANAAAQVRRRRRVSIVAAGLQAWLRPCHSAATAPSTGGAICPAAAHSRRPAAECRCVPPGFCSEVRIRGHCQERADAPELHGFQPGPAGVRQQHAHVRPLPEAAAPGWRRHCPATATAQQRSSVPPATPG